MGVIYTFKCGLVDNSNDNRLHLDSGDFDGCLATSSSTNEQGGITLIDNDPIEVKHLVLPAIHSQLPLG